MKTKNDYQKLNFNEYAFFKGISTTEAKVDFAYLLFPKDWFELKPNQKENQYLTKSGNPKITIKDKVDKELLDFSIKSNSALDGKCQLDYLCEYYNNGISLNNLREHSQNKTFKKALKFTGKNTVINNILNSEQLLKIQKTWLYSNVFMVTYWNENTIDFIKSKDWAIKFLTDKGFSVDDIEKQFDHLETLKGRKLEKV